MFGMYMYTHPGKYIVYTYLRDHMTHNCVMIVWADSQTWVNDAYASIRLRLDSPCHAGQSITPASKNPIIGFIL